jgi:protein gp37
MNSQKPDGISYVDYTWNPVVGCTEISNKCKNCWARSQAHVHYRQEFTHFGVEGVRWNQRAKFFPERLDEPKKVKKPSRIAVAFMGDLYHENVAPMAQRLVFSSIDNTPWHTFLICTARPQRMCEEITANSMFADFKARPYPNVWLMTSVEDQANANERIPWLLRTPAHVRGVSAEPLLGSIDFHKIKMGCGWDSISCACSPRACQHATLDWIVAGGESGPKARPTPPACFREIRDQCSDVGIPFHFKQHGEWIGYDDIGDLAYDLPAMKPKVYGWPDGRCSYRIGASLSGRMLDGREWLGLPRVA